MNNVYFLKLSLQFLVFITQKKKIKQEKKRKPHLVCIDFCFITNQPTTLHVFYATAREKKNANVGKNVVFVVNGPSLKAVFFSCQRPSKKMYNIGKRFGKFKPGKRNSAKL